jgi:DNA-directed RNA polymerase sigma subunit (sigma70/sigma32)
MKKWTRKPRNPRSAETRRLIGLAIEARDEAAARPTPKAKALREAAYMCVIVACERMIQAYAQRFASRDIDPEDLTSTATLGLIEALNRFDDCKSGGGWTGYVGAWMLWKLQQYTGSTRKLPKMTHLEIEQVALLDGRPCSPTGLHRTAKERGAE